MTLQNKISKAVSDVRIDVWNSVEASVINSVSDSVWNSVSDSVYNSVRNSVNTKLSTYDFAKQNK